MPTTKLDMLETVFNHYCKRTWLFTLLIVIGIAMLLLLKFTGILRNKIIKENNYDKQNYP